MTQSQLHEEEFLCVLFSAVFIFSVIDVHCILNHQICGPTLEKLEETVGYVSENSRKLTLAK